MENTEVLEINNQKNFLRRYKKNLACIKRLEDKLVLLNEKMTSVKSPNMSGMPRGGIPITFADMVSNKTDLEDRITRLKLKSRRLKTEILAEIDTLDDIRYTEVLEAFFIDCLPLEVIAENEGYTVRHIYRLYSEAISLLSEKSQ